MSAVASDEAQAHVEDGASKVKETKIQADANNLIVKGRYLADIDPKTNVVNIDVVEREWNKRGVSIEYHLTDKPGREWPEFVHETHELGCILKGKLEFIADSKTYIVQTGDEMFVPKGTPHSCKNISKGDTVWVLGYL